MKTMWALTPTRTARLTAMAMAVFLVPVQGVGTRASRLSLVIAVTEGEHSRDSNSSTTSTTLTGNRIHYAKAYRGYRAGRRPAVDKNVDVPDRDLDRIQKLLVENDLLRSRSSISPTDQPGSYVEIDATITSRNQRWTLKFSGMRDKSDSDTLYAGLRALLNEIEQIVNP